VDITPPLETAPSAPPLRDVVTAAAPPFHLDNLITIQLTPDNYLFWRAKVLSLLRSRSLLGYVDGSLPCPPQVIATIHGPAINPEHRVWEQ
jgi:hypothetical protein